MARWTTVQVALDTDTLGVASAPCRARLAPSQTQRLRRLVDQYFDFAWRSLRRLGVPESSVDDAAQQLFEVLANRLDTIDPERERSFVFGAAVRIAAGHRRARHRELDRGASDPGGLSHPLPPPDELLDHKRARELLDRLLDTLPMELRTVLILAEGEGMTMAEIAEICGIPPGTVASRLRRARAQVLGMLEEVRPHRDHAGEPP